MAALAPAVASAQTTPPVSGTATGVANINITPRRVIFDANKRAEAVYVFNQGNAAVTLDVTLVDNVMLPSGDIVPLSRVSDRGPAAVTAAGQVHSAKPLLLYSPTRLTLGPVDKRDS